MIGRAVSAAGGIGETILAFVPGDLADISQGRVLKQTSHRSWPLPDGPWLMAQTWRDLLFAHWPLPPELVRLVLPGPLRLDTFDGEAWIGVTPFALTGLRPRGLPPLPGTSAFLELNVRTYSTFGGLPGIYFLSLDAANRLAVLVARRAYRLPYFRAAMSAQWEGEALHYASDRSGPKGEPAAFEATYRPIGPPKAPVPGSFDHFLTERYCLYTLGEQGEVMRAEIHHPPWPLQPADATVLRNSMTRPWNLELPHTEPVLHFSRLQNVLIWPLRPAEDS